jgi:Rad3-related DNA helicase
MTALETCIREAVEKGGYEASCKVHLALSDNSLDYHNRLFLDSLFWQALGRARGWETHRRCPIETCCRIFPQERTIPEWKYRWHRFIDHLADGKDAESFFAAL